MMETERQASCLVAAARFLREYWLRFATISLTLLAPCVWHPRIEAGDLGSHVYNAWLAQLIEKGQAPGLYIARQWNNVLFDVLLLKFGNTFGLAVGQKIAVALCVLIFFWGLFAFLTVVSHRVPWSLVPCLAMLAYGWTFSMGFLNYYLSLALGFFVLAIFWRTKVKRAAAADVAAGVVLAILVLVAHPQGFVWLLGCAGYIFLWRRLPGWSKLTVPGAAVVAMIAARLYLSHRYETFAVWDSFGPGIYTGSDQIALYGTRYRVLSIVALLFGIACFLVDCVERRQERGLRSLLRLRLELYGVVVFATYILPDVLRVPLYSGWVGALALRLTTISAALGLCVLAFMRPRKWHAIGFGVIAAVFFAFLYQDTAVLNRMEAQIEQLVALLPSGERVTASIWAPADSRLPYIHHMVDRACIGKCFSFENYEPASKQFRVRVEDGSPVAIDDSDTSQQMEAGEYVVQPLDLPMAQIYQCNDKDLTQLCIRQLVAGETNGRVGYHPPRE
jgi:hypothetical protein